MPAAGAIAGSSVGWPATFYIYGTSGLCWCAIWLIYGASSPLSSRWISEKEKKWILSELGEEESREVFVFNLNINKDHEVKSSVVKI